MILPAIPVLQCLNLLSFLLKLSASLHYNLQRVLLPSFQKFPQKSHPLLNVSMEFSGVSPILEAPSSSQASNSPLVIQEELCCGPSSEDRSLEKPDYLHFFLSKGHYHKSLDSCPEGSLTSQKISIFIVSID